MKTDLKTHLLKRLADAYSSHELRVKPEYQRGTVWKKSQRQGLIDSLLRGYQIPLFYVHIEERINSFTGGVEKTAWLVDGQQRLAAIVGYLKNEFALTDPDRAKPGSTIPTGATARPTWTGLKFDELMPEDRDRLLQTELYVVEMAANDHNEVRDLFIRLQAGTPLSAQEKRDAWPGDFTNFVIRHAGKPGHSQSAPKRFFNLFPKSRGVSVDDGVHYVDGLADTRKFFAGLAMTIMLRERAGIDFVDVKGTTINDFYMSNLVLEEEDQATLRVLRVLDLAANLPEFEKLREGRTLSFLWAFHFALLIDALAEGDYTPVWKHDVIGAFLNFKKEVASAQLHYRGTKESLPHYERFGRLLSGSGSDTAEIIRNRHSFLLSEVYSVIRRCPRDPQRLYDSLEKEVIWNRDRGICQNPDCPRPERRVSFRDAHIHHIVEHTTGGPTTLQNGILICAECHADRTKMQRLQPVFEAHVLRVSAPGSVPDGDGIKGYVTRKDVDDSQRQGSKTQLRIVIDWGSLDVERELQVLSVGKASEVVVHLVFELLQAFGKSMEDQLLEVPVLRFPLSRDPNSFVNPATGENYPSTQISESGLYLCTQSSTPEKERRLAQLFGRLTLPDGSNFPEGSIECFLDSAN